MGYARICSFVAIVLCSCALARAQTTRPIEKIFGLTKIQKDGVTLFYDPALKGDPSAALAEYQSFLDGMGKESAELLKQPDALVAEVDRLVGLDATEKIRQGQRKVLTTVLRIRPIDHSTPLYVLEGSRVKSYLKNGGALPNCSFDKATDRVTYHLDWHLSDGKPLPALIVPAGDPDRPMEEQVGKLVNALRLMATSMPGVAIHEITEVAIVMRLKPSDPYFRWFSDGFANALTGEVLRHRVGDKAAKTFLADYDPAQFADIQHEVNLAYWMGKAFAIEAPLDSEERLTNARYAYATSEAQRLIDRHGIDVVRRVLSRAATQPSNDSRALFPAIQQATGEDMRQRLMRYQSFGTPKEGRSRYAAAFNAAHQRHDFKAALVDLMRLHELRVDRIDGMDFMVAAQFMAEIGQTDAGVSCLKEALSLLKSRSPSGYRQFQEHYVQYCFQNHRAGKAADVADALLKAEPDYVPAMAVRMLDLSHKGEVEQARALARQIMDKVSDKSSPYRQAAQEMEAFSLPAFSGPFGEAAEK